MKKGAELAVWIFVFLSLSFDYAAAQATDSIPGGNCEYLKNNEKTCYDEKRKFIYVD